MGRLQKNVEILKYFTILKQNKPCLKDCLYLGVQSNEFRTQRIVRVVDKAIPTLFG